jgi:ATP-dependent Clp protease adapter protein ClpS
MDFRKLLNELEVLDRPPAKAAQEIELNKPGGFNVVVLNDPHTPGELVVEAIVKIVRISPSAARKRMMRAHRGGWSVIATYANGDIAETIASQLTTYCRTNKDYDWAKEIQNWRGDWPTTFEVMEAG